MMFERVNRQRLLHVFCVVLMCCVVPSASAANAILTWVSEPEAGVTQINAQVMKEDTWMPVEPIYSSKERNFSPSVGSNQRGDMFVVWSATSTVRSVLKVKQFREGKWLPVEILANQGGETTTPAVIFDRNNNAVIVWVSDHNGFDDIYLRRWHSVTNQWSLPEQVNPQNNAPDILPILSLDQQGSVLIRWQSFDPKSQVYIDQSRVYQAEKINPLVISDDHRELTAADIDAPKKWQGSAGHAVMHFPDNFQVRQEKITYHR